MLMLLHVLAYAQLPASFFAYRKQQHRWTCGPVQLWRRCARDIWRSSLPLSAKLELLVLYFGVRKFATHWVSLGFFCTLVPLSIFTPEVGLVACYFSFLHHASPVLHNVPFSPAMHAWCGRVRGIAVPMSPFLNACMHASDA